MNPSRDSTLHDPDLHDPALSELYRETVRTEPPAWLDERILAAAQTAEARRPARILPLRRPGIRRWAIPAALAATVVLGTGVIQRVRHAGELAPVMERKAALPPVESAAKLDAMPAAPLQPAAPAANLPRPMLRSVEQKSTAIREETERTPAAWLADIAELRRQGRMKEAEAQLAQFRQRYPHVPLTEAETSAPEK